MSCNECNQTVEPCVGADCTCVISDQSSDCSLYTGIDLPCSGIISGTSLTNTIIALDAHICNLFATVTSVPNIVNIGGGSEVYSGVTLAGARELRTIQSEDLQLLDVKQNTDTIGIKAGKNRLELVGTDLSLIVNTDLGDTILSTISILDADNFLADVNYNHNVSGDVGPFTLDFEMSDGTLFDTNLELLNNHLETVNYNTSTNNIEFTLTDTTVLLLPIGPVIADAQIQSNVLEEDNTSAAYIQNKNAEKTVTLGPSATYTVVTTDNNKVIEIDNGTNDVTISLIGIVVTSDFFVGFIQKGTGTVTFTGYDILPIDLTNVLYGQGHIASMTIINSTKYLSGTLKSI